MTVRGSHGHVIPNEDGIKARCGGPALCKVCQRELARMQEANDGNSGTVLSKEGEVVGHVGNIEVDPFRQQLSESAGEAADQAEGTLPLELKGSFLNSDEAIADIHGNKRKDRPGDQPLPKVNSAMDCQTTFKERIACDVAVRREIGIQRYGTALQPFNGRSAVQDAWEEFIDLGQYIEQIRRERHDMIETFRGIAAMYANSTDPDRSLETASIAAQNILDGLGITR